MQVAIAVSAAAVTTATSVMALPVTAPAVPANTALNPVITATAVDRRPWELPVRVFSSLRVLVQLIFVISACSSQVLHYIPANCQVDGVLSKCFSCIWYNSLMSD